MSARIFSKRGETAGLDFVVGDEATIGRGGANSVVLDFSAVSGEHARLTFDEAQDCYWLEDLGSLNGTKVDGMPLERRTRLDRQLHVITFGRVCEFFFQRLASPRRAAAEEA